MKKRIIAIVLSATLLFASTGFGESLQVYIEAMTNSINVELNGVSVDADNLLYNGRTYVQLHTMAEMIDADLTWDAETRTAALGTTVTEKDLTSTETATIYFNEYRKPVISYTNG